MSLWYSYYSVPVRPKLFSLTYNEYKVLFLMNPVDHPMGGGEGRQSGGHPRSRKGMPAKGYKTRSPKKQSSNCHNVIH